MKFGIFYEHQLPGPGPKTPSASSSAMRWTRWSWPTTWVSRTCGKSNTTLRGVLAFERTRGVLGPASQRTKRMRLGHGIVQTAPAYNHPARVAERIAMLDLVSGGRVEFGSGESSSEAELKGFGIDPATNAKPGWRAWRWPSAA